MRWVAKMRGSIGELPPDGTNAAPESTRLPKDILLRRLDFALQPVAAFKER